MVGGLAAQQVRGVVSALEREAHAAAARATKRLLLTQLHDLRVLDERLLPGGEHEVPSLLTHSIELHERLRADRTATLAAACDALQPLAVAGRSDVFVYRTVAAAGEGLDRNVFLLRLSLTERDGTSTDTGVAGTDSGSNGETCVLLTVCGVDQPSDELSSGLVQHLCEKLEELTLMRFATLLPRIAQTRLSAADLAFLRPPDAPPLAAITLPLPMAIGGSLIGDDDALEQWTNWLRASCSWLRAGGWCPMTYAPPVDSEVLSLLHVPPPRASAAPGRSGHTAHKALTCVFVSLDRNASKGDVDSAEAGIEEGQSSPDWHAHCLGGQQASSWCLRLRAWGRRSDSTSGHAGGFSRRRASAGGSHPISPTSSRWNGPSAVHNSATTQLLEGLCSALCSRLVEAEVIAAFHGATNPSPGTSNECSADAGYLTSTSYVAASTSTPSSPQATAWTSEANGGVQRVAEALSTACAIGSSAVTRASKPLLMPPWASVHVAKLVCSESFGLGRPGMPPLLLKQAADGSLSVAESITGVGVPLSKDEHVEVRASSADESMGSAAEDRARPLSIRSPDSPLLRADEIAAGPSQGFAVLVALLTGLSPHRSSSMNSDDGSCRLFLVHINNMEVSYTAFSRADGGGAPSGPLNVERGTLPSELLPLIRAFDMQANLSKHAFQLLDEGARERVRSEGPEGGLSPLRARAASEPPPRLLQRGPPAGAVGRSELSQLESISIATKSLLSSGKLREAVEQVLPILPKLHRWWRRLLFEVAVGENRDSVYDEKEDADEMCIPTASGSVSPEASEVGESSFTGSASRGGGAPTSTAQAGNVSIAAAAASAIRRTAGPVSTGSAVPRPLNERAADVMAVGTRGPTSDASAVRLVSALHSQLATHVAQQLAARLSQAPAESSAILCEAERAGEAPPGEYVILRRGHYVSVLRLNVTSDGLHCAVHLLGHSAELTIRSQAISEEPGAEASEHSSPSGLRATVQATAGMELSRVDSEAEVVPDVSSELTALYYDAHVTLCRPSMILQVPDTSSSASIWGGESLGGSKDVTLDESTAGGAGSAQVQVDTVASLRALMREFPSPPPRAACAILEGVAQGPPAPRSQLPGYVRYLLSTAGAGARAPSAVRFLPCGHLGTLGFCLPSPYDAYECVAWPSEAPTGVESVALSDEPLRAHFAYLLLRLSPEHGSADSSAAKDEATRLLERTLMEQWEGYRCFRVWRYLSTGRNVAVTELAAFLGALPAVVELEKPFPSLQSLSLMRLPWSGLLRWLSQLDGMRACHWRDGKIEHLIVLDRVEGRRGSDGGQLVHCELSGDGYELRVRACSTHVVAGMTGFITELTESVANAIACWTWAASMVT